MDQSIIIYPSAKGKKKNSTGKKKSRKSKVGRNIKQGPSSPEVQILEDGIVSLFLSGATQQMFNCVCDEDVTEKHPFVLLKKDELIFDIKMRASVSDFSPVKQYVMDYPGNELLLVYDFSYKYGQNFYLCITEEAKLRLTGQPEEKSLSSQDIESLAKDKLYIYQPPEPKEWIDQGSMFEISEEIVINTRPKIRYLISRQRSKFEAPCFFEDRDADALASDRTLAASYVACSSYQDVLFSVERTEQDSSTQCVPETMDKFAQTNWKYPINASVQYESRTMQYKEIKKIESSPEFLMFFFEALPRLELALQQNLIFNVFIDDWQELGEEDSNLGTKMDSHLKEYQSFTDLKHSKDKIISCVEWHPKIKGVIAVSCCKRYNAEERIDSTYYQIGKSAMILIWSFADPINPQILLESPDEIHCFKFCPSNPNYIAGGCINGQVVLWDIGLHEEKLNSLKSGGSAANPKSATMFGEEAEADIPLVPFSAVSSIENGHKNLITSVQWVPDYFEFNKLGRPYEKKTSGCLQIITTSTDSYVMLWDLRPPKSPAYQAELSEDSEVARKSSFVVQPEINPFLHLDLQWKPFLKANILKQEESGDYSPLNVSISQMHKLKKHDELKNDPRKSQLNLKVVHNYSSRFFIGTEDGEIVYSDFKAEKDIDSGKQSYPVRWCSAAHDGPVVALQRNPFHNDLILSVGGWNFSLWREGHTESPILQSSSGVSLYTCGYWSLSRPAVFYLGAQNGNLEVWDILEHTHEPLIVQNITTAKITDVLPSIVSSKQHLLAIADNIGTLHILEISWVLRNATPNEVESLKKYLDREVARIEYFEKRKPTWFEYKQAAEQAKIDKRKSLAARLLAIGQHDDDYFDEHRQHYENYLDFERKLLNEIGVTTPEDDLFDY